MEAMSKETRSLSLGERIAYFRKIKDWKQKDLAEKIGVYPAHLSKWEKGHLKPSADVLAKVAEALELTVDELVSGQPAVELQDPQLLRSFQKAQGLPQEDKAIIVRMIDALTTKQKMEQVLQGSMA